MHHTSAYVETTGGAITNGQINALTDGVVSIRNNNFFPTQDFNLIYCAGMGATNTNVRLDSPTLRQISQPNILPLTGAVIPGAEPKVADYTEFPFPVPKDEELEAQVSNTAIDTVTVVIGLQSDYRPVPSGRIYTLRATSTTAATANAWSNVVLTYDQNLPSGRYAIVGGAVVSANCKAFRFNLEDQKLQPGGIGTVAITGTPFPKQRLGGLGVWGEFNNTALPELQVLCNAADAAFTVFVDIVPIGR